MIRRPLLLTVVMLLPVCSGCMFWRKSEKPKESTAIAADVEASFRQRWLDKRAAEIVAQGENAEFARGQAAREFAEKFEYLGISQK